MQAGERFGPYEILFHVKQGGMADVYKARHAQLHRDEALKVPLSYIGEDDERLQRFLREARTAAKLHHPNIATIYTVSEDNAAQPYFAMEYVEGEDLSSLIARRGRMPLAEVLPIARQIADALDYAHNSPEKVVHRDIKPGNILLKPDGKGGWSVKLVDFGIADAQSDNVGTRLTKTGMIVGTPEYMSPEQAQTPQLVGKRSDIYSFAIVVYEMLCGQPPFRSEKNTSPISVLMKHVQEPPPAPVASVPDLPAGVNKAILKALAKNPLDRFDSCTAFVKALGGIADDKTGSSSAPPKWLWPSVVGVLAVGAALVVFGMRPQPQVVAPPPPRLTPVPTPMSECGPHITQEQCAPILESRQMAEEAAKEIDQASARREELIAQVNARRISGEQARQENDRKLMPRFAGAEKQAKEAIDLHRRNEDAWIQYCRAGYYLAATQPQFKQVLARIAEAEKSFPGTNKFALLKQLVRRDGEL